MTLYHPDTEWSTPITLPEGPSILRVNAGAIRLVYSSAPDSVDDGQKILAGQSVTFGFIPGQTIRMKAISALRDTEVYIGQWWS